MRHKLKRQLEALISDEGLELESMTTTGSGHICLLTKEGGRFVAACTPSDNRGLTNLRADIRRFKRLSYRVPASSPDGSVSRHRSSRP